MAMKRFKGRLIPRGPGGAWTFLAIPFSVEEAFGSRARVAVSGTLNGFAFRNSLMPEGDGTHSMMVNKALQAGAKAAAAALKEDGVNACYYESPGTAHEWQTWRRSLYQFAQLLFKDGRYQKTNIQRTK